MYLDRFNAQTQTYLFGLFYRAPNSDMTCVFFYEAICCMSYFVPFCSCVFQSFLHCDYLAGGRES